MIEKFKNLSNLPRSTQLLYKSALFTASAIVITAFPLARVLIPKISAYSGGYDGDGDGIPDAEEPPDPDPSDPLDPPPDPDPSDSDDSLANRLESVQPNLIDTDESGRGVLIQVAARVINIILLIAGILAVIYLVWSGVIYITAGGDTGKADKGRVGIINAIIGLVIIAAAFLIIRFVSGTLSTAGEEVDTGVITF